MISTRIRRLIRQQWAGLIALFFVLGGGSAYALDGSNTVFSDDIVDGEVKEADIGQGAVASPEVKNDSIVAGDVALNSLTSPRIADGSLTGTDVANNSLGGVDIDESTLDVGDAARAYGHVTPAGVLSRSKNVDSVSHPTTGIYCIELAGGIDPSSAVLVAIPDLAFSSTSIGADVFPVVQWDTSGALCPAERLAVWTFTYDGDSIDDDDGGGNTTGDALSADDEAFAFLVP
jgi:hypothetical protein